MKKYSLARETLYPETALVDPLPTLGLPRAVTVSTGLDALSHALESIWNVNANPVSSNLAEIAAREVLEALPLLADDLASEVLRTRLARASLFAGLAFSNTRTALAHALSYHLTLHHGVPHGIACSFSLPMVMRAVAGCDPACDASLKRIFGPDLLRRRRAARSLPEAARHLAQRHRPRHRRARLGRRWSTTRWRATAAATSSDAGRRFWPKWPPEQENDDGGNNDQDHTPHIRSPSAGAAGSAAGSLASGATPGPSSRSSRSA